MICPACQHENPPSNAFCGGCGSRLTRVCSACQHENPANQRFCGGCGQRLEGVEEQVQPLRDPRAYTPKHLADKILQSKSAMEGERRWRVKWYVGRDASGTGVECPS